jgi:glutamate racemase
MTIYVGFAMSDTMFPENCSVERTPCPLPLVLKLLQEPTEEAPEMVVNCCNAGHVSTLKALKTRYGIDLTSTVPATPPKVSLKVDDVLLVLGVDGLPRLTIIREYTDEEIAKAKFRFGMWKVI